MKEKCPTSMIFWNPHVCTSLYIPHVWWSVSTYELWIVLLVMCSCKSCYVSFFPSSPRGTYTRQFSCVPREPCHVFKILSVKLLSIELSQSCDSGKPRNLRNLSNLSSSVISMISVLSNLSNFSIPSQS